MSIPLYLKLKSPATEDFDLGDDGQVTFNDKVYNFTGALRHDDSLELLADNEEDERDDVTPCYIFMGPTGSGKTTTLRELLNLKLKILKSSPVRTPTFLSAFEVSNNNYATDLLEHDLRFMRKEYHSTRELSTKKVKVDLENKDELLDTIFRKRLTKQTPMNTESSRSCLIVNLIQNGKKIVYMDLMGNEKFDKTTPTSNIFANMNVSSITQMLAGKLQSQSSSQQVDDPVPSGRSSNFITNLIFKRYSSEKERRVNIVLVIDPRGDKGLNKSAFRNIADIVQSSNLVHKTNVSGTLSASDACQDQFNVASPKCASSPISNHALTLSPRSVLSPPLPSPFTTTSTSIASIPTATTTTSFAVTAAPNTLSSNQPHYTKPTIASLSPERYPRSVGRGKRSASLSPVRRGRDVSPKKRRVVSDPIHSLASSRFTLNLRDASQVSQDNRTSFADKLANSTLKIQLDSMKKQLEELESDNLRLKAENQEILELSKQEKQDSTSELASLRNDNELAISVLNAELRQKEDNENRLRDEAQKSNQDRLQLTNQWNELREEFFQFQHEHDSFVKIVDSLRVQLSNLKKSTDNLVDENSSLSMELKEIENSNKTLENTLATYEETIMEINTQNEKLSEEVEEKDRKISKLSATEEKMTEQLLKTKEQLDKYNQDVHTLKEKLDKKEEELEEAKSTKFNLMSLNAELETSKSELVSAKLQLEQTDELLTRLNTAGVELEQLNATVQEKDGQISDQQTNIQTLVDETQDLKNSLQHSQDEKETLESKLEEANEMLNASKSQLKEYKEENEELTKKLATVTSVANATSSSTSSAISSSGVNIPSLDSGSFPKLFGSFSPPSKDSQALPSIDFLDQFTNFNDSMNIFQGPQIFEDYQVDQENQHSQQKPNETQESDIDQSSSASEKQLNILGPSKTENLIASSDNPDNKLKRSGTHFHHPPLKSSKLRNVIFS